MQAGLRGTRIALVAILILGLAACSPEATEPEPTKLPAPTQGTSEPEEPAVPTEPEPPAFDRTAHSIDDPTSIWVVSNKQRPLDPIDFAPADLRVPEGVANKHGQPLREAAAQAVEAIGADAAAAGHTIWVTSAYRDHGTQVVLYNNYVARDGQAAADRYSARPGHSEHQTGLAVDLHDHGDCYLLDCFGETPAGMWLAEHAAEYGFVLRYPAGKEGVTGFTYEPWHFRFVGEDLALEMQRTGVTTLEEFFGLDPAPNY